MMYRCETRSELEGKWGGARGPVCESARWKVTVNWIGQGHSDSDLGLTITLTKGISHLYILLRGPDGEKTTTLTNG